MKTKILLLLTVFVSSFACAATTKGKVEKLYINESGLVLFSLSELVSSPPSAACSNSDWQYAFLTNVPAANQMYSMLLTAYTTKTPIEVYYTSCHPNHNIAVQVITLSMYEE